MSNHLGDTNKMVGEDHIRDATKMVSDTPRTDRVLKNCNGWHHVPIELARELERELNAANERIKRLEEAGDVMANAYRQICYDAYDDRQVDNWFKAKEAKP